jgi:hypothetical protein
MSNIYIGDIRNSLKLIEKLPDKRFKCLCLICNKEHTIQRDKFGRDKSCGCERIKSGKNNHLFTGYEELHGAKWSSYIRNAKKRNIKFNISIEYAWSLYISQNRLCSISKLPIYFWKTSGKKQATASLDRINNSIGYIEGNVHWVHKDINQIKMDMDLLDFINLCKIVAQNN